jgi:RNAse (barnase) inhibitor barstar
MNGVYCTKEEIESIIVQIREKCLKQYLYPIVIHIFLPKELISIDIDNWCLEKGKKYKRFGNTYKIIVRAEERLDGKYEHGRLWNTKYDCLQSKHSQSAFDIFEVIHIEKSSSYNIEKIVEDIYNKGQLPNIMAVKLPQPLSILSQNELDELFSVLSYETPIPLALWVRQSAESVDCCLTKLINIIKDCPLKDLPEKIKQERMNSDKHIGRQISLFWDDPNLLPPGVTLGRKNTTTWD